MTEEKNGIGLSEVEETGLLTGHTALLTQMDPAETIVFVEHLLEESREYFDLIQRGVDAD